MPRETIYAYGNVGNDPADTTVISVGWGRGSYVQVGVGRGHEADLVPTAWTEALTRDQINNLIRVLRKARDQVHGRDE